MLAFGSVGEALGWTERTLPAERCGTLADCLRELEHAAPQLAALRPRLKFAINQRYATTQTLLRPGDELALIPPVAGG